MWAIKMSANHVIKTSAQSLALLLGPEKMLTSFSSSNWPPPSLCFEQSQHFHDLMFTNTNESHEASLHFHSGLVA